jgi:hypothetical protein
MNTAPALDELLARPDVWRGGQLAGSPIPALASGFAVLDAELPGGGWPRGTLTEILVDGEGFGECSLVLPALARMREEGTWSVLVAPPYRLNGPAWAASGIDPARVVLVSPMRQHDALWATEQALSNGALGSVLCWTKHTDARQTRRLQVAVAGSGTLAFMFRPLRARTESSAATLRLMLSAGPHGTLAVDLLKRRGPPCNRTLYLDVSRPQQWREDYESSSSPLARSAPAASSARSQRPFAFA